MTNYKRSAFLGIILIATGCASFTPPAQMKLVKESGTYWLNYSSDRRGAIVRNISENDKGSVKICAEPAPDTSNDFEVQGVAKKEAIGEASLQSGQNVIILPGRNSTVLTLRESLYRLCELSINRPDISPAELMNAYNKVIIAVTRYAEAEVAKAEAVTSEIIQQASKAIALDKTVADVARDEERKGFEDIWASTASKAIAPDKTAADVARDEERKGFENIASGNFEAALYSFKNADAYYPGYHNVFEIGSALAKMLADEKVYDAEKQAFYRDVITKWSWGAPSDVLTQIKTQVK